MSTTKHAKKLILIIHRDSYQADSLQKHLSDYSYEIEIQKTGNAGLESAKQHKPDVILASSYLKDMDGIDLCWMIRQTDELAAVPFFLLTDYINDEERINAYRSGVDAVLESTTSFRELYTRIEAILKRTERTSPTSESDSHISLLGKISHISVVELLQFLNISQKSGTVIFTHDSQKGEIGFWEGKIVWARQDKLIGEDAVQAITGWTMGTFQFEKDRIDPIVNVHTATMQLILDCCKTLDEQRAEG